jgi:hypothetical protein
MPSGESVVVEAGSAGPPGILKKRVSIDFGTIPTLTTEEGTAAFADADAGDGVVASPAAAFANGLIGGQARVSSTGVISIPILNATAGTLTPNTLTFDVYVTKGPTT